ncbi:MAG: hypothetical protein JXB13_19920 [Phycisphaerae bacterium]|nr:hypothetical protein [Phycisphaerae bacterium]
MEIILILLFVLAAIVLVGHGIWAGVAWLVRGGRSRHSPARYEPTLSDDRAATARLLRHLRSRGAIDDETYEQVMRAVTQDIYGGEHSVETCLLRRREREVWPDIAPPMPAPTPRTAEPPLATIPTIEPPAPQPVRAESSPTRPPTQPSWLQRELEAPRCEPPPPPRRPFSEILAGFMAEKNIRWGELIGGLLIVCCSAALVISLWSRIEAIPVLKFVIFTAMTAALFGAGLFVYYRWKIPMTGQVVLFIATFLVPLNLLAFAAFSLHGPVPGAWTTPIELGALVLFGWLLFLAARVVMPAGPRLFAGAVVGISACSLAVRFTTPLVGWVLWAVALLPVVPYVAVTAASCRGLFRDRPIGEEVARRLFLQLGVYTFSCLVPFGLIICESGLGGGALRLLSPLVSALAIPALFTGVLLWLRLAQEASPQTRTAAASVAIVAASVAVLGVGLGWPVPARLIPATLVVSLAMAAVSLVTRHPAAHASAASGSTVAWVLGVHVFYGLDWSTPTASGVLSALLSARTGQALVVAAAVCALSAAWLARQGRGVLARSYAGTALGIATISLTLVTVYGFGRAGDPSHVTWIYLVYAVAAFVAGGRVNSPLGVWCGGILGQMAIVQLLVYLWPVGEYAWPTALLVGASACAAGVIVLRLARVGDRAIRLYTRPLAQVCVTVSLVAAIRLGNLLPTETLNGFAIRTAWLSALWLGLGLAMRWSVLLAGAQIAMAGAGCAGMHAHLQSRSWYAELTSPLGEPWVWQAHAVAVGAVCLVWAIVRAAIRWKISGNDRNRDGESGNRRPWTCAVQRLLNPEVPLADRWMILLVVAALVMLSVWSVGPGIVAEHAWGRVPATAGHYVHASGAGSWVLLGVLAAVLLLALAEGLRIPPVLGLVTAAACGVGLSAARFESQHQVVTVLRWLDASFFLGLSGAVWLGRQWSGRIRAWLRSDIGESALADYASTLLCVLFALPAAALTLTFAHAAAVGRALSLTDITEVGLHVLLLGPPFLVAVGLMGYGRATRRPEWAVATTVLAGVVVTVTELCVVHRARVGVSYSTLIWLVQLNVIVAAAIAVVWRALLGRRNAPAGSLAYPSWILLFGRAASGLVLSVAAADLWIRPGAVSAGVAAAGTAWGFFAVMLVEGALWSGARRAGAGQGEHTANVWVLFGAVLLACGLARYDTGNWLCFHMLMAGLAAAGWLRMYLGAREARRLLGSGWRETFETATARAAGTMDTIHHDVTCRSCGYNLHGLSPAGRCPECHATIASSLEAVVDRLTPRWAGRMLRVRTNAAMAVLACAALATAFAVRAAINDPQGPWWSVAVLAGSGALCMVLAGWAPRRAIAYAGGVEICAAASIWWITEFASGPVWRFAGGLAELVNVNVIALAAGGLVWLGVERGILRGQLTADKAGAWPAFHRIAAWAAAAAVLLLAGAALCDVVMGQSFAGWTTMRWFAWGAAVVLMVSCRLDTTFRHQGAGLHVLGFSAVVLALVQAGLPSRTLVLAMSLALAGYVLFTMLVWRCWAIVERDSCREHKDPAWLVVANGLLVGLAVLLGLYVSFTHPGATARLAIVASPILCAASAAIGVKGRRSGPMRTVVAGLMTTAVVLLAWSWVSPGVPAFLLQRAIGVVAAVAFVAVASSLTRRIDRPGHWAAAAARSLAGSYVLAGAALLLTIGVEAQSLWLRQPVHLSAEATASLIGALALLIVCCVVFAVRDYLDPLRLRPSWRGAYVYLAEGLAGALVLHVRATMPWLFSGVITQYWPLLIMALAFAAVAAGEICARQGLHVLARPLGRSGMFLPALSTLELFLASSQVHFSIVLVTTGVLYTVLAGLRKSLRLGLLAGLALNGSLWYLLAHSPGLGLTQHPQLWFIPPALAVLVAGHLNRARLNADQRTAVHYVCVFVIYLSSAADVFLVGVARAPWLPLVLAGLSLAGIFVGFVSRIRSFLFLGTGFLCLSLLTMIWHAAANLGWTWLWYVSGIALGVGIITVFALFEKKREELNAWIDDIRQWNG